MAHATEAGQRRNSLQGVWGFVLVGVVFVLGFAAIEQLTSGGEVIPGTLIDPNGQTMDTTVQRPSSW